MFRVETVVQLERYGGQVEQWSVVIHRDISKPILIHGIHDIRCVRDHAHSYVVYGQFQELHRYVGSQKEFDELPNGTPRGRLIFEFAVRFSKCMLLGAKPLYALNP